MSTTDITHLYPTYGAVLFCRSAVETVVGNKHGELLNFQHASEIGLGIQAHDPYGSYGSGMEILNRIIDE